MQWVVPLNHNEVQDPPCHPEKKWAGRLVWRLASVRVAMRKEPADYVGVEQLLSLIPLLRLGRLRPTLSVR